jgi:Flp pilus assembly protein TadG
MLFAMIQFGLLFTGWAQLRNAVQTGARMAAMGEVGPGPGGCSTTEGPSQQMVCEIEALIGQPVGTSSPPEVGLLVSGSTVTVCAQVQGQALTGFVPTTKISSVSSFYINPSVSLQTYDVPAGGTADYNPYGLPSCE